MLVLVVIKMSDVSAYIVMRDSDFINTRRLIDNELIDDETFDNFYSRHRDVFARR